MRGGYEVALANLRRAGIRLYATFVVGYDYDTPATLRETGAFALRHRFFISAIVASQQPLAYVHRSRFITPYPIPAHLFPMCSTFCLPQLARRRPIHPLGRGREGKEDLTLDTSPKKKNLR